MIAMSTDTISNHILLAKSVRSMFFTVRKLRRGRLIIALRILPRFWDDTTMRNRMEAYRELSVLQLLETDQ